MTGDFVRTTLGNTGLQVHRLGLSATYRPGRATIHKALDGGLNFFFAFGIDGQMMGVLREILPKERERYVVATGAYNMLFGHPNLRRTLEKRLRQLNTEYIDVFMYLGVTKPEHFPESLREEYLRLREEGKIRFTGISTHDRRFAGELARRGALDIIMMRYNAAHRGAERDIFPHLQMHNPGIVGYTATRWHALLERPRTWPENRPIPDAGMCYRFVLTNPNVHVCLTAPRNMKQFQENLTALERGPLDREEMSFMAAFGDAVYQRQKWFM
jgi:aryl-alcohol dehydrogenase-like predicted oxidoreductase